MAMLDREGLRAGYLKIEESIRSRLLAMGAATVNADAKERPLPGTSPAGPGAVPLRALPIGTSRYREKHGIDLVAYGEVNHGS
jgi:hypothetical protein